MGKTIHGYRHHPVYTIWRNIKKRCYNKNNKAYKNYGGRGISMCKEWFDPKTFIEWALPLWKKGLQIDRRDNDGNYTPENCRFVTQKENNHNKRLLRIDNKSGFCGVSWFNINKKWRSRIGINNKQIILGYFDSPIKAASAYDAAVPDNRPKNFK